MKQLKFHPKFVKDILETKKSGTWRMFDTKDLKQGDIVEIVNSDTGIAVGNARITQAYTKTLATVTEDDFTGHNRHKNDEAMLEAFRGYYGESVTMETPLKIIRFELVR